MSVIPSEKIGILAGSGMLVTEVIKSCQKSQNDFFIIGFEGQSEPQIIERYPHTWTQVAKVGRTLRLLKDAGVTKLVMAGKFQRPSWHELRPDVKGAIWLKKLAGHVFGDDSLLTALIALLEQEGFDVVSAESLIGSSLLMESHVLTLRSIRDNEMADIQQGKMYLSNLSILDIGQAIVIQQGLVLGVEAIEGTDILIKRCQTYKRQGPEPILIKMCKKQQDTRVDRPTIGPKTIQMMADAGFAGCALESGGVIILEQVECIRLANHFNLFITGI